MGLPPSDLLHYGPHFMSFAAKSYYRNLRYNRKRVILGPFLPNLGQMRIFSKNPAVTFVPLWTPDFMQKIRKIVLTNSEKSALQDERTNRQG